MSFISFSSSPRKEHALIILVGFFLLLDFIVDMGRIPLILAAFVGSIPTAVKSIRSVAERRITIDTFNILVVAVSFAAGQIRSSAFIVLMLISADLLEQRTASRMRRAVEELMRLKPHQALRVRDDATEEVAIEEIKKNDVVLVRQGAQIPIDGVVVFGTALVNEAVVTGESMPEEKIPGDHVVGGTLCVSGILKVRATDVGKDSTLERMAALIQDAQKHKSRHEKLADRFASLFLPAVLVAGALTYGITRNIAMTAALFLVACADDMAVAIPLAVTAAIGQAASRGVIVKGGEWLNVLGLADTLVLDKTGTLTYGTFRVTAFQPAPGISPSRLWRLVGIAEKFSEHPIGRMLFHEARRTSGELPDPDHVAVHAGGGISARTGGEDIVVGNEELFKQRNAPLPEAAVRDMRDLREREGSTVVAVTVDGAYAGYLAVADMPRPEAAESLGRLKKLGIQKIIMLTGDNERVAHSVARILHITEVHASMTPEKKLSMLERLKGEGRLAMVGDGINDAPALTRADVGIAMGGGGTAVAVEAADIVILTDQLNRIPEMVRLGRDTTSVIRTNMWIWFITNGIGFALVLTGWIGPARAAFYNFATDFLPILNSARLFRGRRL